MCLAITATGVEPASESNLHPVISSQTVERPGGDFHPRIHSMQTNYAPGVVHRTGYAGPRRG